MTILTVGPEQQFKTIKAAVAASQDGDTIYVQAGTYVNDVATVNHKISIIGVGGMVQMTATRMLPNDKGFFVVNNDVTIDHFEFSGAKSYAFNGAGIRYQAGNLTVTNSYFHDNQDGIMGSPSVRGTGSVTIKNSEFAHNGTGDGQAHNIYVGFVHDFTITDSYTHDAYVGHELKSRALNNTIVNNRIDDGNGNSSYSIDLPSGGNALIANNVIHQGLHSQNRVIINYASETTHFQWDQTNLVIKNNIVSNDMGTLSRPLFLRNVSAGTPTIDGNSFYGLKASQLLLGNGTLTNNTLNTGTPPAIDTSHPWTTNNSLQNIVSIGIGDDVLHGTSQNDLFVGGVGHDVFVITPGGGNDVIADFKAGASPGGDVVEFVGTNFTSFADVQAAMSQHGADVWLDLGKGEVLTFKNVDMNSFVADDFTFETPGVTTSSLSSPIQVKPFTLPKTPAPTTTISGSDSTNDLLIGTSGNDSLFGKKGADTMIGGLGDDHYHVDNAGDVVTEQSGGGIDTVHVTIANYTLGANVENAIAGGINDLLVGNSLNNRMSTGGNGTLNGMDGNDILIATLGDTHLTGGAGNDIFQLNAATSGMSTITDFTVGEDLIDLRTLMATYPGADPVADGVLTLRSDGNGGTIFSVDPTHSGTMVDVVDVQNIDPTAFHMGYDYIF